MEARFVVLALAAGCAQSPLEPSAAPAARSRSEACAVSIAIATTDEPGCWLTYGYSSKACGSDHPQWTGAGPDGTLVYFASINPPIEHDGNGGAPYAWAGSAPGEFRIGAHAPSGDAAFVDLANGRDGRCSRL